MRALTISLAVFALTTSASAQSAAPPKSEACAHLQRAIIQSEGGQIFIDHKALSGGNVEWPTSLPSGCFALSDSSPSATALVSITGITIVNTDPVRFTFKCANRPFAEEADRDTIFAGPLPDLSISLGDVVELPGTDCSHHRAISREFKVRCAAQTLNAIAEPLMQASTAARQLQASARRDETVKMPTFPPDLPKIKDSLEQLENYTLTQSDIDALAREYSAYPREIVAPIAERTRIAVELTPMIEEGLDRLIGVTKTKFAPTQQQECTAKEGQSIYLSVRRTLPGSPLTSFSRVFSVNDTVPSQSKSEPQPPQPSYTPTYIFIDHNDHDDHQPPPASSASKRTVVITAGVLYVVGAHDDSFTAVPAATGFVVQRSSSRDTSLRPALSIDYGLPWLQLDGGLTLTPSTTIPVVGLGVSHAVVSQALRLGIGLAFAREMRLSRMRIGDAVASVQAITTSESYRPHPYLSIGVDLNSLLRH